MSPNSDRVLHFDTRPRSRIEFTRAALPVPPRDGVSFAPRIVKTLRFPGFFQKNAAILMAMSTGVSVSPVSNRGLKTLNCREE